MLKNLYLGAAMAGAIIPGIFFTQFGLDNGLDLRLFITSLFANGAAGGFTADLLISSFVFWLFMFQENSAPKSPKPWLYIALNLCIGLSCALPAYLYTREKLNNDKRG